MASDSTDLGQTSAAAPDRVFQGNGSLSLFDKCRRFTRARDLMASGYFPYFLPIAENLGTEVVIHGERKIMIGSNNYLGLVQDPRVKEAAIEATRRHGSLSLGLSPRGALALQRVARAQGSVR